MVLYLHRHGYLQSLPAREYVPMFWTEQQQELLKGTDAQSRGEQDRQA